MNKATRHACFCAFILTLCVLGLGLACLTVECNLRQTLYGQVEPDRSFSIQAGVPTLTPIGQTPGGLPETHRQGIAALLPPGTRATLALLQGETEAAARLWEWLLG